MFKRIALAAMAATGMMCAAQAQNAPVFNWSGLYIGGTVGYGWNKSVHDDTTASSTPFNMNGPVLGGTLGANFQRGQWVYGFEVDLSYADINGTGPSSLTYGCVAGCVTQLESFGTVRARLGIAYNNFLPFVTAGFAYGRIHASIIGAPGLSRTETETGWTVGAGLEYAWRRNWSVKAEYLYVDLGEKLPYSNCGTPCSALYDGFSVVRLGVNYHW